MIEKFSSQNKEISIKDIAEKTYQLNKKINDLSIDKFNDYVKNFDKKKLKNKINSKYQAKKNSINNLKTITESFFIDNELIIPSDLLINGKLILGEKLSTNLFKNFKDQITYQNKQIKFLRNLIDQNSNSQRSNGPYKLYNYIEKSTQKVYQNKGPFSIDIVKEIYENQESIGMFTKNINDKNIEFSFHVLDKKEKYYSTCDYGKYSSNIAGPWVQKFLFSDITNYKKNLYPLNNIRDGFYTFNYFNNIKEGKKETIISRGKIDRKNYIWSNLFDIGFFDNKIIFIELRYKTKKIYDSLNYYGPIEMDMISGYKIHVPKYFDTNLDWKDNEFPFTAMECGTLSNSEKRKYVSLNFNPNPIIPPSIV